MPAVFPWMEHRQKEKTKIKKKKTNVEEVRREGEREHGAGKSKYHQLSQSNPRERGRLQELSQQTGHQL